MFLSGSVYLDPDVFPVAKSMTEKRDKERLPAVGVGPLADIKTKWNEGVAGVEVAGDGEISLMSEEQKDKLSALLKAGPEEPELWTEASNISRENMLPERAVASGLDSLVGDEDEEMAQLDGIWT